MGGYGSGRRWCESKKLTVEECRSISTAFLSSNGGVRERMGGCVSWVHKGKPMKNLGLTISSKRPDGRRYVRFEYNHTEPSSGKEEACDYWVPLDTTPCNFGGVRYWFICPLLKNGRHCGRRVRKLYLPPGGRYFGCRQCHKLTYRSCQEGHKFEGLYRIIGARLDVSPAYVRRAVRHMTTPFC